MKTFRLAWAEKEAAGYQYGREALENVEFGWQIACDAVSPELDVARAEVARLRRSLKCVIEWGNDVPRIPPEDALANAVEEARRVLSASPAPAPDPNDAEKK